MSAIDIAIISYSLGCLAGGLLAVLVGGLMTKGSKIALIIVFPAVMMLTIALISVSCRLLLKPQVSHAANVLLSVYGNTNINWSAAQIDDPTEWKLSYVETTIVWTNALGAELKHSRGGPSSIVMP